MPVAAKLVPVPASPRSNTATVRPRSTSRQAIDSPMTPAPITATSTRAGSGRFKSSWVARCGGLSRSPIAMDVSELKITRSPPPLVRRSDRSSMAGRSKSQSLRRYKPDQVRRISALTRRNDAGSSGFSAPCRGSPWNARSLEQSTSHVNALAQRVIQLPAEMMRSRRGAPYPAARELPNVSFKFPTAAWHCRPRSPRWSTHRSPRPTRDDRPGRSPPCRTDSPSP